MSPTPTVGCCPSVLSQDFSLRWARGSVAFPCLPQPRKDLLTQSYREFVGRDRRGHVVRQQPEVLFGLLADDESDEQLPVAGYRHVLRGVEAVGVRLRVAERGTWRKTCDCEMEAGSRSARNECTTILLDRCAHLPSRRPFETAADAAEAGDVVPNNVLAVNLNPQ